MINLLKEIYLSIKDYQIKLIKYNNKIFNKLIKIMKMINKF